MISGIIGGKKNQGLFWNNRVLSKNNYLEFTRFSCSITDKFTRNIASNIASKNDAKD